MNFLNNNIDIIFFFYGFAYVVLGIIIFAQIKATQASEYKLINILWLLGLFGITHGANELIDMFTIIKGESVFFNIIGFVALSVSYFMIFLFGYSLVNLSDKKIGKWFPVLIILSFIGLPVLFGINSFINWSISARYFMGFTGALLTAFGLPLYYKSELRKLSNTDVKKYFIYAASFFAVYGILGGLVVPKASFFPASMINNEVFNQIVGIPVQLFRTFCAIGITFSMIKIINIFNIEAVNTRKKSKEFTKTIFDNVNDSISIVDVENFNIIDANKKFLDSLNVKKEDVVGKKCYEVTHKRTEPCVPPDDVCPIDEMLQTGKSVLVEHVHYEKDGNKIYGEVTASPIFDDNGKVIQAVHISRDITERKKAEIDLLKAYAEMEKEVEERTHDLKQSENKFRNLAENITDWVWEIDKNMVCVYSSPQIKHLLGYSADEVIGKQPFDFMLSDEIERIQKIVVPLITAKKPINNVRYKCMHKDGYTVVLETNSNPILDDKGELIGYRGVDRDVTKQEITRKLNIALNKIHDEIISTLNFDEIMQRVVEKSMHAIGCESVGVILREGDHWKLKYANGELKSFEGQEFSDTDVKATVLATTSLKTVVINDSNKDKRANPETVKKFNLRSYALIPLIVKSETIGVLGFFYHSAINTFSDSVIDFAEKLATSVSLAVENSRMYESEHIIADTLQKASLTIPEKIKNVDFGHIYKSATETAMVGGDFYDLFELEQNKVGIVIGDVSGKGLEAATLTSLIKNTIKAYAYHENSPALVINKANNIILQNSPEEVFITLFFGILDIESGLLTYCSAGHPPQILRKNTGEIVMLSTKSPILGVIKNQDYIDQNIVLEEDDALILYTDGITEARFGGELFGEERLLKVVEEIKHNLKIKDYPDFIIEKVSDFTKGSLVDDIAILSVSLSK